MNWAIDKDSWIWSLSILSAQYVVYVGIAASMLVCKLIQKLDS